MSELKIGPGRWMVWVTIPLGSLEDGFRDTLGDFFLCGKGRITPTPPSSRAVCILFQESVFWLGSAWGVWSNRWVAGDLSSP